MPLAAARGRASAGLSNDLLREPGRFDFFQAVRLLGRLARGMGLAVPGDDVAADQEAVRFRAVPSLSFPASAVATVKDSTTTGRETFEIGVSFFGLVGAAGVLPYHYARLLLERLREKDEALRDYLDVFQQRLVTLFYQAREKYRLPFAFERGRLGPGARGADPISQVVYCLAGFGTDGLRGRLKVADGAFLFYSGHFAHYPRAAAALEAMLAEYFELPARVLQLQGQWLDLEPDDCSRLAGPDAPDGLNCGLGASLLAGSRVWDIQSRFRLRLGPLGYEQFRRLLPGGDMLEPVAQLARTYAGPELDFDVQLVLKAPEVPWCRLGDEAYLGWNTWVRCEALPADAEDTVFAVDGLP